MKYYGDGYDLYHYPICVIILQFCQNVAYAGFYHPQCSVVFHYAVDISNTYFERDFSVYASCFLDL